MKYAHTLSPGSLLVTAFSETEPDQLCSSGQEAMQMIHAAAHLAMYTSVFASKADRVLWHQPEAHLMTAAPAPGYKADDTCSTAAAARILT